MTTRMVAWVATVHSGRRRRRAGFLLPVGGKYAVTGGRLYNLVADDFISDHGNIISDEVAYALLTAVAAT